MLGAVVGDAVAVAALIVSVVSLTVSLRIFRRQLHVATITEVFDAWHQLSELRIANWRAAHLLALPRNYGREVELVSTAVESSSDEQFAAYRIQERAVALRVFELFEQTVYQLNQARDSHDSERQTFLEQVQFHFTGRLLRNPRLLYMWSAEGSALADYFEDVTKAVYAAEVLGNGDIPEIDRLGPYRVGRSGEVANPRPASD